MDPIQVLQQLDGVYDTQACTRSFDGSVFLRFVSIVLGFLFFFLRDVSCGCEAASPLTRPCPLFVSFLRRWFVRCGLTFFICHGHVSVNRIHVHHLPFLFIFLVVLLLVSTQVCASHHLKGDGRHRTCTDVHDTPMDASPTTTSLSIGIDGEETLWGGRRKGPVEKKLSGEEEGIDGEETPWGGGTRKGPAEKKLSGEEEGRWRMQLRRGCAVGEQPRRKRWRKVRGWRESNDTNGRRRDVDEPNGRWKGRSNERKKSTAKSRDTSWRKSQRRFPEEMSATRNNPVEGKKKDKNERTCRSRCCEHYRNMRK